jgi:hypothetical protein
MATVIRISLNPFMCLVDKGKLKWKQLPGPMQKLHVSLSLLVQPCQPLDGLSFSSNQPLILNPKKITKNQCLPAIEILA